MRYECTKKPPRSAVAFPFGLFFGDLGLGGFMYLFVCGILKSKYYYECFSIIFLVY